MTQCLSCTKQQTESLPLFNLFLFERYDRCSITKKYKGDHKLSENVIKNGAGFPFVCTCGSNTRFKFEIETRKIERGIAAMPLVLITTCSMYRNRFGVVSLWVTNWAVEQISIVSLCLQDCLLYTNFHLIRERRFCGGIIQISGQNQKDLQKLLILSFLRYDIRL